MITTNVFFQYQTEIYETRAYWHGPMCVFLSYLKGQPLKVICHKHQDGLPDQVNYSGHGHFLNKPRHEKSEKYMLLVKIAQNILSKLHTVVNTW